MGVGQDHQHGAREHQVACTDHVGRPRACFDNSRNRFSVFPLMTIFNIY